MRQIDADKLIEHLNDIYLGSAPAPGMSDAERQSAIDFCNGLQEAMEVAAQYAADCRLLTLEEIIVLPEGAMIWEECRFDWNKVEIEPPKDKDVEFEITPVVKWENRLHGCNGSDEIEEAMFGGEWWLTRYWTNRPTDEMREAAA